MCFHYIVVKISVESMSLPPVRTLERRASARAAVRSKMEPTEHSLEFRPENVDTLIGLQKTFTAWQEEVSTKLYQT